MKQHRRKHNAELKARVALEAVKGIKTISEIAQEYETHPIQISIWKKELLERLPDVFNRKGNKSDGFVFEPSRSWTGIPDQFYPGRYPTRWIRSFVYGH